MRCFNCGMENLDNAMFCEKCGTGLVLPPIETQPEILNVGQGKILGIVPQIAFIPVLGLVIGAFAFLFYFIGWIWAANTISSSNFNPFDNSSISGPEAMMVFAAVLGVIAVLVFLIGTIRMILRSD
jgi:hypothetical protein